MPYKNKADLYKSQIFRWRRIKDKAIEYKGGKCYCCGKSFHPAAMQFHHNNPNDKDFNWTKMRLKSWDKIQNELDKCSLVCANCHSIIHSVSKYDDSILLSYGRTGLADET